MLRSLKNRILDLKIMYSEIICAERFYKVPFFTRLKMNLNGFTADQYIRYKLKENDIREYISEFERWKSRRINGRYNIVLDDKLLFPEVFGSYVPIPSNLAWIKNGVFYSLSGGYLTNDELLAILAARKKLVIKPVYAQGSGRGVYILKAVGKKYLLNDERIDDVIDRLSNLDNYVVVEFIQQHQYADKLFRHSTNTIRLITTINKQTGRAIITNSVHRIGVEASIPVDNGKKGALVAEIDIVTGIMGQAKTFYDLTCYSVHPETNAPIKGVKIPFWAEVKEQLVSVAERFPYIPFMAWDVVITDEGFYVIEINTSSGVNLFQMWRGERNRNLGDFYREHNIIR